MNKITNIFIASIFLCATVVVADEAEYEIGAGLLKFQYEEFTDSGVFLDGEYGYIPGVILKRKQIDVSYYNEWVSSLYGNTIKYEGKSSNNVPLTTKSDAIIFDTHLKFGLNSSSHQGYGPYIGLGYRYWLRNIYSGNDLYGSPVSGLTEYYHWFYALLGFSEKLDTSEEFDIGIDVRFTHMFNAKMDIYFKGFCDYDDAQVNLGNKSGARFALPIKLKKNSLTVTPFYEVINIGRSNNTFLTSGGVMVDCMPPFGYYDAVYEPRSETRNIGIELTWLW